VGVLFLSILGISSISAHTVAYTNVCRGDATNYSGATFVCDSEPQSGQEFLMIDENPASVGDMYGNVLSVNTETQEMTWGCIHFVDERPCTQQVRVSFYQVASIDEKNSCDSIDKASESGNGKKKGLEKAKENNGCN